MWLVIAFNKNSRREMPTPKLLWDRCLFQGHLNKSYLERSSSLTTGRFFQEYKECELKTMQFKVNKLLFFGHPNTFFVFHKRDHTQIVSIFYLQYCSLSVERMRKDWERKKFRRERERGDDMKQGHKLDLNPQHLEYMTGGWETTTSHQPNSGNLCLCLVGLASEPASFGR